MVTLEKLVEELRLEKVDEILCGATTTKGGVAQSSGENDWITYTTTGGKHWYSNWIIKL
ncbi:hypothetical protein [Flavobacterium sp.]|uniref:hypothetical protein n=1 Tax=Flavobacterium sp. TaxID=239 RepID=UPI003F6A153C